MQSLLFRYSIPGGALAVVQDGRLVFARGYGYADTNSGEIVQPDSLFRPGSLGKAITAAAVLKLVEEGRISLTNSAFNFLNYSAPTFPGATVDPRLPKITLQNLLNHTGGWDVSSAVGPTGSSPFSPLTWSDRAAHDLGLSGLANSADVIRWSTGFPLQFEPGTGFVYANIGYQILGRVIEKLTGETYESHVKKVISPLGITRMKISGDSILERNPGEVVYYDYPTNLSVPRAISYGHEPRSGVASLAYAYSSALLDSAGGCWASSSIDHLRFICAVDGRPSPPDILSASSIQKMTNATSASISAGEPHGMGWNVNVPGPGDREHNGGWYGSASELVLRKDGIVFMYVFNHRPYLVRASR